MMVEKLIMAMRTAADKKKKEDLSSYFTKTFKKEHLPGELSVGSYQFVNELSKVKGPKRPGESLR
jgi:hypothetical protein